MTPAILTGAADATCSAGSGTCSILQGSASWTTPATPGALTATCTGKFQAAFGGPTYQPAVANLTTVAAAALPPSPRW